ncbi:hypothetical protein PRIPAC_75588 [Pristionchus pacificus]|uniref:Uncharacterized protein n=1 Tax=Pristionchus pacificus TaxID=54126 RepID=A0A2A6CFB8_PRIPA|nr:hypothetical protein PRIPAC_75588 [Pristionchus pacificus]|eukprot:PDM76778.1 hypothetical protein PRIPAC_42173 [Pristionchus pacificus]
MVLFWNIYIILIFGVSLIKNVQSSAESNPTCDPPIVKPNGDVEICISITLCDGAHELAGDDRLIVTAVALITVDDNGKIIAEDTPYIDRQISTRTRKKIMARDKRGLEDTPIHLYFKNSNLKDALNKVSKFTDAILYVGSDYENSYDKIRYTYTKEFLQMNNDGGRDLREHLLYKNSLLSLSGFVLRGGRNIVK